MKSPDRPQVGDLDSIAAQRMDVRHGELRRDLRFCRQGQGVLRTLARPPT